MDAATKKKIKIRVNRVAGQVAGVGRMVDENRYCVDILHQIAAVRSALDSLGIELVTNHVQSCILGHGSGTEHECAKPMTKEQLIEEMRHALSQFLK